MKLCRVFAMLALCAAVMGGHRALANEVPWTTDLEAARAQAAQSGKLLLIHFWTPTCGPCKKLDQTVFNQSSVAGVVTTSYVPVKLNANEFPAMAESFGITRVPTDVVTTPNGRVIDKYISPATSMEYITKLDQVAKATASQTASLASRGVDGQQASTTVNPAYANLSVPSVAAAPVAPAAAPGSVPMVNPYAQAPAPAAVGMPVPPVSPLASPQQVTNSYAQSPSPVDPQASPVAPNNQVAAGALAPAANPAASLQPQLPANSPPLGFDGYCPVTMKREWKWIPGNVQWGAYHRGRTYLFAGQAQRDEFLKNPDAYSPVLSGIDPVLAIDGSQVVPGSRRFAVEYAGQFYMFSSEETLSKFWTQADKYSNGVRQAMAGAAQPSNLR